jgi:hypothetical protein
MQMHDIYSVLGVDPTVYQLACVCEVLFKSPVSVLQLMALTCRESLDKDKVIRVCLSLWNVT